MECQRITIAGGFQEEIRSGFDAANAQYLPAIFRAYLPAGYICDVNQGDILPQKIRFCPGTPRRVPRSWNDLKPKKIRICTAWPLCYFLSSKQRAAASPAQRINSV